ncbi:hypothetical protein [Aeoliella sp. SH292]|uniref:hypothetical protein n=1 Tax=Aeoliella sp. SH292 TaxID=3454464 RepID=UPI003F9B5DFA
MNEHHPPSQREPSASRLDIESKHGKASIRRITERARWGMRSVQRIGLDQEDLINSTLRTALRREGTPEEAPAPEEDIWAWFEKLFWKKRDQYKGMQRTQKHGWKLETDAFTSAEAGIEELTHNGRQSSDELSANVETYVRWALSEIRSDLLMPEQREIARLLVIGCKPKEIALEMSLPVDSVRRKIRRLRRTLAPSDDSGKTELLD